MKRATRIAVLGLSALLVSVASADDARLPVPDAAAKAPVVVAVKKQFKDELKAKDVEAKRKLVQTLLDQSADAKRDAVERFVSGELAQTVAEEIHDVRLAVDAAHRLGAAFQVPRAARCVAAVDASTRGVKETSVLAEGAAAFVDLAGEALAEDDSSTAGKAASSAKALATSAKLGGLAARAAELPELIAAFRKELAAAGVAEAALAADGADPGAHEALGRHLAFGRGDWKAGLEHLARGLDAALKDVAAKDASGADKDAVADAWWDLAQKEKDPLARARMVARAAARYAETGDDATEDRRKLAKTRLDAVTWRAWERGVALTKDFSKAGPDGLALATIRAAIEEKHVERKASGWRTKVPKFPDVKFTGGVEFLWTIETNLGVLVLRLAPDAAPQHVANCIWLTELGFYDGLTFHRVIPGFMAQGGAVNKDGTGGPDYKFDGEFASTRKHDKAGVLSTANAGPGTDNCGFFITFAPADHLDGKHTIFGELISGADVLKKIEQLGSAEGKTKSEIVINSARITTR